MIAIRRLTTTMMLSVLLQKCRCFSPLATSSRRATRLFSSSSYQITTPIYYVNDKPHIGHAYTSIACDVLARYQRLHGRDVFFLTGTDEHGEKVQQSAENAGQTPMEFCTAVSTTFSELNTALGLSHDAFIRTTDESHKRAVQHFWKDLESKGYIYKGNYEGWYAIRDECFYSESELVDGKAPTGAEVEWVTEESYFFKLSALQDKLLAHYEENPDFIAPEPRRNEVLKFVQGGLRDLSISRTSFSWGIPVPGDEEHVMYVWMDALCNYISALEYPNGENMSKFWPAAVHVVGKDILRFHAVYWPAFLMAADLPLPQRLFAHGWWTKDGQKISKSIGNVIDPFDLLDRFGVDATRFFLMSEVSFGSDGDYSDLAFVYRVNANLANELGNLCQRTLSLVFKNCDKQLPTPGEFKDADKAILEQAEGLLVAADEHMDEQAIEKFITKVMIPMVVETNKYIDVQEPWVLKKTDPDRMVTVLYVILEVLRRVAVLYQPVVPESAGKMLDALTVPEEERSFNHLTDEYRLKPGTPIKKPKGIFPRLDVPVEAVVS